MDQLPDLTATATALPWWHYVLALVSVVAGFVLARYARRGVQQLLRRTRGIPEPLSTATARFTGYLVIFLGIGIGLAAIGIDIQPLLAIVLIVVVIVVFVLKGVADNFAAGVLLQTSHPVVPGDEVTVEIPDGTATGVVLELGPRTVSVRTYDGRTIQVPNARFVSDAIVVTTAGSRRRVDIQVRATRGAGGVSEFLDRLRTLATQVEGVDATEPPSATALSIGPDRVTAQLRFWADARSSAGVAAAVVLAVATALEDEGLEATVTSLAPAAPVTPPDAV